MLFNSYEFLFIFLPATLLIYFFIARFGREAAISWLVIASLFFYGWWNPVYVVLIVASMLGNYWLGRAIGLSVQWRKSRQAKFWLALGVIANLAVLGYFKYANFAVNTFNQLSGADVYLALIVLPLGISFFTFQQIAYLVDARHGITHEYSFRHYALFVTFFPQLIAGPIVHHKDILPQFMQPDALKPQVANISIGLSIFVIGLLKKTVLADGVAPYATPVFNAAAQGEELSFFVAWGGALAYTLQLYFDFSGYSDMAIGGARLFGIRLPLNFHSPYRATSIVEFWRRWHMTLSRFLRDYLYIPLGGNRGSKLRRYRNLILTMLLGGLWHGAGWTFVIWGGLHGMYLAINHAWTALRTRYLPRQMLPRWLGRALAWAVTFLAVVMGWVYFRAASADAAWAMLQGMFGFHGIALPNALLARLNALVPGFEQLGITAFLGGGSQFVFTWVWILALLPLALFMPNTQQIMALAEPAITHHECKPDDEISLAPALERRLRWRPTLAWAVIMGIITAVAVLGMANISEFLYFQF